MAYWEEYKKLLPVDNLQSLLKTEFNAPSNEKTFITGMIFVVIF